MSLHAKSLKSGTKGFSLQVLPTRSALDEAIAQNGFCHPSKCWHKVAISRLMNFLEPGANHWVKVDAGHVTCHYRGWRYRADTPRHVKRSLMLFDAGRYDEVHIRQYTLRFRRMGKIVPKSEEEKAKNSAAQAARRAEGRGSEHDRTLRRRVAGFSSIV